VVIDNQTISPVGVRRYMHLNKSYFLHGLITAINSQFINILLIPGLGNQDKFGIF